MDEIFHDVKGLKGAFTVVKVANEKPNRFGKNGELLIKYEDTEAYRRASVRRSSMADPSGVSATKMDEEAHHDEKKEEDSN